MHAIFVILAIVLELVALGLAIRSFIRVAAEARAAGELNPGAADSGGNSFRVYRHALANPGPDTAFMAFGFIASPILLLLFFALAPRLGL